MTPRQPRSSSPAQRRRVGYHHGNLREALIEAALRMFTQHGGEAVSMREVAKRVGVSAGAPFRHFASRTALMTAVAEQAMSRLRDEIVRALAESSSNDPLDRFRALGTAYIRWVVHNPEHFKVISNRNLIDFDGSKSLRRNNDEIRSLMEELLTQAQHRAPLRSDDIKAISLAARGLAYGIARMYVDGHLPQWQIPPREVESAFNKTLDLFVASIAGSATESRGS
jgi:AcrR family transcriptional regulator